MLDSSIKRNTEVLHIRSESHSLDSVDPFDALWADNSLGVEVCPDVYRGLARLCRTGNESLRTVVVCMDGLGVAELEFFTLASRLRRGTRIYVYSQSHTTFWMTKAIKRGANGVATADLIRSLAANPPLDAPSHDTSPDHQESTFDERTGGGQAAATVEDPMNIDPQVSESGQDAQTDPVRVPWLRYQNRPTRTAPERRPPTPNETRSGEQSKGSPSAHEPLLTNEELEALIGDGGAGIDPGGDQPGDRNDPQSQGVQR